jgi:hypothetical protein
MGQPCQWNPEVGMKACERPNDGILGKSSLYMRILGNVEGRIKVYEIMAEQLPVDC